jgi:penicillin-binding protein A
VASFALGIWESGAAARAEHHLVVQYVGDWARGDFRAMYGLLDIGSQRRTSESAFHAAYVAAAETATLERLIPGKVGSRHGSFVPVRFRVRTHVFGTLDEVLEVPLNGSGSGARVAFEPSVLFPGLRPGERLHRHSVLGARGTLLADNGQVLAEGPDRTSTIPEVASQIVGSLGPIPAGLRSRYAMAGYPANARVGQDGLERIFQRRLAGQPGGTLLAGQRVLASVPATAGETVKTTINPTLELDAVEALGGSYAGMTVMDPHTGALLALVGLAFSDVQPPGSTMKIVTSAAALTAGLTTIDTVYPYATEADLDGYEMKNSDNESCGGTLIDAFANSCNSVFAPLGADVGGQRLVAMAEKFGFNHSTGVAGALESTIPSAATIGDALAVGSSAIGQGMVQASTLEMDDVGATIADGGRRPIPTLLYGARPRFITVISPQVANEIQQMMVAVVQYGTGTTAQIPGVEVAGKTGTAELTNTANQTNATQDTDAWFVGYAPVGAPRVVATALFPSAGFGAQTAAPAVAQVIEDALSTHF